MRLIAIVAVAALLQVGLGQAQCVPELFGANGPSGPVGTQGMVAIGNEPQGAQGAPGPVLSSGYRQELYEKSIQLSLCIDGATDASVRQTLRVQKRMIDVEIEESDRSELLAATRALEAAIRELTERDLQKEFAQAEWNCTHRSWRHGFRYPYSCSHFTFWR